MLSQLEHRFDEMHNSVDGSRATAELDRFLTCIHEARQNIESIKQKLTRE